MPGTAYSISTIQSLLQPIFDSYKKSENPFFSVRMQGGNAAKTRIRADYSHSIVAGGLLVTSSTTRLISRHSFVIRVEIAERVS